MKRRSLLAGAGALAAAPLIDVPTASATGESQSRSPAPRRWPRTTGGAARPEGRRDQQPDRHPRRPEPHRRHHARLRQGQHRRGLRPRARLPRQRPGRRLRGRPRRSADRDHGLRRVRRGRRQARHALHEVRCRDRRLRHPGRRCALLHLHLDHVRGDARRGPHRRALRSTGSAEPDWWLCPGPDAQARVHEWRRQAGDHPAARDDRRRAGPVVQRGVPAAGHRTAPGSRSCRSSRRRGGSAISCTPTPASPG